MRAVRAGRVGAVLLAVTVLVVALVAYRPISRRFVAKQFLQTMAAANQSGSQGLLEQDVRIEGASGAIRARLYRPASEGKYQGLVVAYGVHFRGIDEQRLVPFVRQLARGGLAVLTPELADLADYRLTRATVDQIAAAVLYLQSRTDAVGGDRVGLLGFSFAGGLSLVAAAESGLSKRLKYVVSVGGHHDLERVHRFLVSNQLETPNGIVKGKAHDYGLAVMLYGNLNEFLPESELEPVRAALRAWLHEDRPTARNLATQLQGDGLALYQKVEQQKLSTLEDQFKAIVARKHEELAALSPKGLLRRIEVPAYLLHGAHDSVIPPSEAEFASLELGDRAHDVLVTPLIEHVEVGRKADLSEQLMLVAFMAHLFE